jgi:hypothetical protein
LGIEGKDLVVSGVIHAKYQAAAASTIKANQGRLGLSYEVGQVQVVDENAAVWHLQSLTFCGAACLLKDAAAYAQTSITARRYA